MEFSFFSMISQASLVAKIVLCILVLMSVGHDDPETPGPQRRLPQGPAGHRPVREGPQPA